MAAAHPGVGELCELRRRRSVRRSARSTSPSASACSSGVKGVPPSCLSRSACNRRSTPSGRCNRARLSGTSISTFAPVLTKASYRSPCLVATAAARRRAKWRTMLDPLARFEHNSSNGAGGSVTPLVQVTEEVIDRRDDHDIHGEPDQPSPERHDADQSPVVGTAADVVHDGANARTGARTDERAAGTERKLGEDRKSCKAHDRLQSNRRTCRPTRGDHAPCGDSRSPCDQISATHVEPRKCFALLVSMTASPEAATQQPVRSVVVVRPVRSVRMNLLVEVERNSSAPARPSLSQAAVMVKEVLKL